MENNITVFKGVNCVRQEKNLNNSHKMNESDESWIFLDQAWSVGDIIRHIREEQEISLYQLANGICSVPTLSRIEAGDRDPDLITLEIFLSRLGYQPQKFEMIGSPQEFEQYEARSRIRTCAREHQPKQLRMMLEDYIKGLAKGKECSSEVDSLHWQFIKEMEGNLLIQEGRMQEGLVLLEESIAHTLPQWQKPWYKRFIASSGELKLLHQISGIYESQGKPNKAYEIKHNIRNYLNQKHFHRDQMPQLYTEITCELVPYLLEHRLSAKEGLHLCNEALKVLADTNCLCNWCDLLYLKGRCTEVLTDKGEATEEEAVGAYQRAYYIYRLMKKETEAQKLKQYLKEKYQWESI